MSILLLCGGIDAAAPVAVGGIRSRVVVAIVGVRRGGKESRAVR